MDSRKNTYFIKLIKSYSVLLIIILVLGIVFHLILSNNAKKELLNENLTSLQKVTEQFSDCYSNMYLIAKRLAGNSSLAHLAESAPGERAFYYNAYLAKQDLVDMYSDYPLKPIQAYYVYFLPVYSTTQNQEAALGEYLGLCAAFCRKSALAEVMSAALMDGMSMELHSAEGTVLEVKQNAPSGVQTKLLTNTYAYPSLEWTMIQRYFSPQFSSPYPLIFTAFLLIALCVLALLSLIIHRNFIRPITELNAELLCLSDDPLAAQKLNIACPNEFNTIAHSINVLLEQLIQSHHKQVEQQTHMLRVELSMNQLQLALLQSQINPHFLYNTLACIRGIALENNVRVIAELVTNMATLYRYSIKGGAYVQLSSELEIIQRYLYIMNLRMDNKFRVRMEIPEQLKSCWIAKMILQPLVENAIFHGLECSENGGEIRIYATWFEGDNAFLLNVYDNGEGIEQKTVNRLNELFQQTVGGSDAQQLNAKGVGMLNVHRKIRLHHGDAYGLHVESEKGKFTRVCALLPVLEQCPEHNEKA